MTRGIGGGGGDRLGGGDDEEDGQRTTWIIVQVTTPLEESRHPMKLVYIISYSNITGMMISGMQYCTRC
jgi:hypothetical protein